ncbi:hypothetical protein CesoFtcFv8_025222 [Champsocephalus esox]|uniref:Uncharacterized protein n=1 Tax=Champsocephalus esox TaxID=159716 RepID=A0AAN8B3E0_9TELE|nr:hypothetical protein CesoFtcFv8_025222 [Champsocephalus esox]
MTELLWLGPSSHLFNLSQPHHSIGTHPQPASELGSTAAQGALPPPPDAKPPPPPPLGGQPEANQDRQPEGNTLEGYCVPDA